MNIFAEKNKVLILGRQGENLVTAIKFPVSKWVDEYGSGTFALVHQRKQDAAAYPVTITNDGNNVIWTVGTADVRDAGEGSAQLSYTVNGHIAKSEVFRTNTLRSLDATANPPSAWQAWVDQVLAAGTAATTAVSHYPRINSTNNHWEVWSNNSWTDTGVLAKGSTPVITSSKVDGTTTVKADGATIATLLDGTNGTDGHSPVITASKTGGVTTVSVDGSAVATINDGVTDVKVGGTSIVTDGVASVPIASSTQSGTVVVGAGLEMVSNGTTIRTKVASSSVIDARTTYNSITPQNIDYAVKSAITAPIGTAGVVDGVYQYPSYTDEEKARARDRLGFSHTTHIATVTVTEELIGDNGTFVVYIPINYDITDYYVVMKTPNGEAVPGSQWNIYYGFGASGGNRSIAVQYCPQNRKFPLVSHVMCVGGTITALGVFSYPTNTFCCVSNNMTAYTNMRSIIVHAYASPAIPVGTTFDIYI